MDNVLETSTNESWRQLNEVRGVSPSLCLNITVGDPNAIVDGLCVVVECF